MGKGSTMRLEEEMEQTKTVSKVAKIKGQWLGELSRRH